MANPYGAPENPIETAIQPLDYSFLNYGLSRLGQEYQSGVNQVKSLYSSVLNAPITNDENKQVREEYINQAQQQLKALAKTDLSLPQNINQSQKVFAPFWQDNDIIQDIVKTKNAQSQLGAAETDRTSKDETIRKTHNPWSVTDIQYSLQDLKNAKRGDGSISNVEVPRYTPQLDIMGFMDQVDKDQGFKGVDYQTPKGPYMITEHDGVKAIPQFRTRMDGALGPQFSPQFSVQGKVQYKQDVAEMQRNNPNIDPSNIPKELANYKYQQLDKDYQNRINHISTDLKHTYQDPIDVINKTIQDNKGKVTSQQTQDLINLQQGKDQYQGKLDDITGQYKDFKNQYPQQKIDDIARNPEQYYGQLVRSETVDRLAKSRASDYSYKIDANQAWKNVADVEDAHAKLQLDRQKLVEEQRKDNLIYKASIIGSGYTEDRQGNLIKLAPSAGEVTTSPQMLGEATTTEQKGHFTDVLATEKNTLLATAAAHTWNAAGVSGVLTNLGISTGDLTDLNTLMNRYYTPGNIANLDFKQSPSEVTAFQRTRAALQGYFGQSKEISNTYQGLTEALHEYVAKEADRRTQTGSIVNTSDPFVQAYVASGTAKEALGQYQKINQDEKDWIKHQVVINKDKYGKLLNDEGTDFATSSDIEKHIDNHMFLPGEPHTMTVQDSNGSVKTLSSEDLAEGYQNRTLNIKSGILTSNNKVYKILKLGDRQEDVFQDPKGRAGYVTDAYWNRVIDRFGTYDEQQNLNTSLAENASKNLSFIKDKTGKIGVDALYPFGTEKAVGNGEKLIAEGLTPGNRQEIKYSDGSTLDPDDYKKVTANLNSYKNIRDNAGQPHWLTVSESGRPMIQFQLNEDKNAWGTLAGKTINVTVSPNAKGQVIQSIPENEGIYTYGRLLNGESIHSDDLDAAYGIKYSVEPNTRDHPTVGNVYFRRKMFNNKTGRLEEYEYPVQPVQLANSTPDDIMQNINKAKMQAIVDIAQNQKKYNIENAR